MALVTKQVPDFTAEAVMPDGSFSQINITSYRGKYVLMLFYPLDFTFVCPSEIVAFHNKVQEFTDRNVQVLAVSIDSHFSHAAWRNTPYEQGGIGNVAFPLVSDLDHSITRSFGIEHPMGVALRGLFLIDKEGFVRHQVVNDLPLGRSVEEAIRMVDALQFTEKYGEVCPANWKKGQKAMKPTKAGVAEYMSSMCS